MFSAGIRRGAQDIEAITQDMTDRFSSVELAATTLFRSFVPEASRQDNPLELTAYVYSPMTLKDSQSEAIAKGLSRFGDVAGITFTSLHKRVNLPTERDGSIDMGRVGMRKLDPKVPLHLFAIPKSAERARR